MFDWTNPLHLNALEYLQKVYQGSPFAPSHEQIEKEALDIVDETNSRFGGDFNKWLQYQRAVEDEEQYERKKRCL